MKITIAERLHPFSHRPGTKFLLPGTSVIIQVFPTRLQFSDTEGTLEPLFLTWDVKGPLQEFTAELDLEKARLRVFGITKEGPMRYFLQAKEGGVWLTLEKAPKETLFTVAGRIAFPVQGSVLLFPLQNLDKTPTCNLLPRLSLGLHRAQDWELICRRLDLKEILPLWWRLSALSPCMDPHFDRTQGNYPLLEVCRQKIEQKERETVLEAFAHLFLAASDGVLVPRLVDSAWQGIVRNCAKAEGPVMPLLTEAGRYIGSLFIQELQGEISLLPCLPPQLHCGRMIHLQTSRNASVDFEWTKKSLRAVVITSQADQEICLKFPKDIRSFRCRQGPLIRRVSLEGEKRATLILRMGTAASLDRFES